MKVRCKRGKAGMKKRKIIVITTVNTAVQYLYVQAPFNFTFIKYKYLTLYYNLSTTIDLKGNDN